MIFNGLLGAIVPATMPVVYGYIIFGSILTGVCILAQISLIVSRKQTSNLIIRRTGMCFVWIALQALWHAAAAGFLYSAYLGNETAEWWVLIFIIGMLIAVYVMLIGIQFIKLSSGNLKY